MKGLFRLMSWAAFPLATLCTGLLVYNMVAMPIYKEQVFLERGAITAGVEMIILIGFVLMPIFNIVSLLCHYVHPSVSEGSERCCEDPILGRPLPNSIDRREGDGG